MGGFGGIQDQRTLQKRGRKTIVEERQREGL